MSRRLTLELLGPTGWVVIGGLEPDDMAASISNSASGNREVIRFRWEGNNAIIDRSVAGADVKEGEFLKIITHGWDVLATLHPGEDYEIPVLTDQMTQVHQMRWRYVSR